MSALATVATFLLVVLGGVTFAISILSLADTAPSYHYSPQVVVWTKRENAVEAIAALALWLYQGMTVLATLFLLVLWAIQYADVRRALRHAGEVVLYDKPRATWTLATSLITIGLAIALRVM